MNGERKEEEEEEKEEEEEREEDEEWEKNAIRIRQIKTTGLQRQYKGIVWVSGNNRQHRNIA
jgi:hypothetical protein